MLKVKGYLPKKIPDIQPTLGGSIESVIQAVSNLNEIKRTITELLNEKIQEADNIIQEVKTTADQSTQRIDEKVAEFESTAVELIRQIKAIPVIQGNPGKDAETIDIGEIVRTVLEKVPKLDEKSLTQKILKALPENKASLKIIQETFEADPMSVIDKILALPKGKFKLKTEHIDGLEQTIAAFRHQITSKGYLHGGGDTVGAGTNITIATVNGVKVISSTGGSGFTVLTATQTPNGIRTTFTFAAATAQPSFIVSDGIWLKATSAAGNTNWSWNNLLKQATLSIPPTDDVWAVV